ncbi:MAG: hypothetical protein ACREC0_07375 [Methylocella sp.]
MILTKLLPRRHYIESQITSPGQWPALPVVAAISFFLGIAYVLASSDIVLAAETTRNLGTPSTNVYIVNGRNFPIFVGFTTIDHKPGPIAWTWNTGCIMSGNGAKIAAGATCSATVIYNSTASRFCATLNQVPIDCFNAQANNQTMVETNFEPARNPGCFHRGNCVWFDISVIPPTCTDNLWKQNQCTNTGGASYNLPVSVACNRVPVYTCQGPPSNIYGPANYPSACGNPYAACPSGSPGGPNAYFYPMFDPPENKYQPNTVCLGGQALTVTFLSGR